MGASEVEPLVSVILPVYNSDKYLSDAIHSILAQTYNNFELIIINDHSTDQSMELVRTFSEKDSRIRVIQNPENIGISKSLNKGLEISKGVYIARMDADDISFPDRLEKQVNYLQKSPEVGVLSAGLIIINEFGVNGDTITYPLSDIEIRWHMLFHNAFCHPCSMLRADVINTQKYNPEFPFAQDYEFWGRLLTSCNGANIDEPLIFYRESKKNISSVHYQRQQYFATKVAHQNIESIAGKDFITFDQTLILRDLYNGNSSNLHDEELYILIKWIQLFHYFSRKYANRSNHQDLKKIKIAFGNKLLRICGNQFFRTKKGFFILALVLIFEPLFVIKKFFTHMERTIHFH
jgi:glycosyltransferase involved in cell wall biosynthesis